MPEHPLLIIQARTGSTRLPQKTVMAFDRDDRSIFNIIVENLLAFFRHDRIVLATTTDSSDDVLAEEMMHAGLRVFRGSREDVLQRFIGAAEQFGGQTLVRICADNPFLMPQLIRPLLDAYHQSPCDYLSFGLPNGLPVIRSHWGLFTEITNITALKKAAELTADPFYHEHVTNYLYGNPDQFKVKLLPLPPVFAGREGYRFTIDHAEDFEMLRDLYVALQEQHHTGFFSPEQLFEYLDRNGSDKVRVMRQQIDRNAK